MRVLTPRQTETLNKLVRLAGGNSLLVEEAIRMTRNKDGISTLDDVVSYIVNHRDNGAGERRATATPVAYRQGIPLTT